MPDQNELIKGVIINVAAMLVVMLAIKYIPPVRALLK